MSACLLCAVAMILSLGLHSTASAEDKPGVIIQVSDNSPAVWLFTLRNVENMQTQLGKVKIEVVAFGPGIYMLKRNSAVRQRVDAAMKNGVAFSACEASMRARKLTRSDMQPGVAFVPSGVAEIVNKQLDGWSYLKP